MALAEFIPTGNGWRPDIPDFRDFRPSDAPVQKLLSRALARLKRRRIPRRTSIREWFAPVPRASQFRDDSVRAVAAIVEYLERRAIGSATPRSARFLYHVARRTEGSRDDIGVGLRTTLKALVRFGMPPANLWLDEGLPVDAEPSPLLYGFASDFRHVRYVRLDDARNGRGTLQTIRRWLAAGIPCVIGFSVPTSLSRHPDIPFRPVFDGIRGGAAAVVIGYDDDHLGSTKGALRIRSVWGPHWGEQGYGWLSYAAVQERYAQDVWAVTGLFDPEQSGDEAASQ